MCYFEIQADDIERAATFYRELFGWSIENTPGMPVEYRRLHGDGLSGGLLPRPAPAPEPGHGTNAFTVSLPTDDFDQAAERIAQLGGLVALPKFAVPGRCWQGYFLDTEGNTFGLYEVDENAA